jgi:hypothetical protein
MQALIKPTSLLVRKKNRETAAFPQVNLSTGGRSIALPSAKQREKKHIRRPR